MFNVYGYFFYKKKFTSYVLVKIIIEQFIIYYFDQSFIVYYQFSLFDRKMKYI